MHDDADVLEQRIRRELRERVRPLIVADRRPLLAEAGPDPDRLVAIAPGTSWGVPWGTTWFKLCGEIPDGWASERVEAIIDLGFHPEVAAGFQCEGLVVELDHDGGFVPLQGIHPRRTNYELDAKPGPVELYVEAASNPAFPGFRPSTLGLPDTAGDRTLYRFRSAELVVVDREAEALAYDIEVLDGLMRTLAVGDPRRARLRRTLASALDRLPDVAAMRALLAPTLAEDFGGAVRHRAIACGHAHIDTAWLWPIRETRRKCTRTFASAVRLMDAYPEYRFVVSSAQHYAWIEEQHPELFRRIVERVERGQWIPVGGMWVESDMNLPSGESLVRQIVHGQRYFEERFGMRCTEVWIPDVFGYPAGLPQVFAAGGMRRFVTQKLSWNKQNRFPHNTFWWEGLDGTRVLTHFPPVDTYNAEITPTEVDYSITNFRDHGWSTDSLIPFGHGDGGGGPTREMLERARRLARLDPRATVEIGTPSELFDRIESTIAAGTDAPVWRGELYFEMHRGTLTSQLRTKLGNRRCERLLVEAELWAATLGRPVDLDHLWKSVLTHQFHDILPGSSIAWVHHEAEEAFAQTAAELEVRIGDLLADVGAGAGGPWVANRADVAVDEVVIFDLADGLGLERFGESTEVQRLADGRVAVRASVPAFGLAPLDVLAIDAPVEVSGSTMTNGALQVTWDAHGELESIVDLTRGRELIPDGERGAVVELAVDQPVEWDAWDIESWTRAASRPVGRSGEPVDIEVVDHGPLVASVRVTLRFGASTCRVTYRLRAGSPQLDVAVDLDWQHDEHLLSMAFPLDVRADNATCDVQFGVVSRPTHPSSPWDAAKFEVCAHRYVDLAEPGFGVAVLNDGRFGHNVFDGAIRVSLARSPKYPDPDTDHGLHHLELAVLPHGSGLADVRDAASRLEQPLRIVGGGGRSAKPAPVPPVVAIVGHDGSPARGVEVDAVKLADDGSGDLIVRLHEAVGDRTRLALRARATAATRCNLLEEPEAQVDVAEGAVELTLRPFELVTLRIERAHGE